MNQVWMPPSKPSLPIIFTLFVRFFMGHLSRMDDEDDREQSGTRGVEAIDEQKHTSNLTWKGFLCTSFSTQEFYNPLASTEPKTSCIKRESVWISLFSERFQCDAREKKKEKKILDRAVLSRALMALCGKIRECVPVRAWRHTKVYRL